jgi:hypothetical protein
MRRIDGIGPLFHASLRSNTTSLPGVQLATL